MFIYIIYWLIHPILFFILIFSSIFNFKIRHHLFHERASWKRALQKIHLDNNRRTVVLFHAASKGEYEQLLPVLKLVDKNKYFILQTFFSPTIFRTEKESKLFDAVCYHPFDFIWNPYKFFKQMNIKYYITTRNDLWPNHLFIANKMNIKTILINANIYPRNKYINIFVKYYYNKIMTKFNLVLTGSVRLKNDFSKLVDHQNIIVTGDSRIDRVIERKKHKKNIILPKYFIETKTLILGSIVLSDLSIIFNGLSKYYPKGQNSLDEKNHSLIIVPHEVSDSFIKKIESKLNHYGFTNWSYYSKGFNNKSRIIIIDNVGILADLYAYSDLSYVGAGFSQGVHSIIEPASYSNAISYGPNYHIVDMAIELANKKLTKIIYDSNDFYNFLLLFDNNKELNNIKYRVANYFDTEKLASKNIINAIFT